MLLGLDATNSPGGGEWQVALLVNEKRCAWGARRRRKPHSWGRALLSLADAVASQIGFTSILTLTPSLAQCRSASTN
jgi:hypothetical protein